MKVKRHADRQTDRSRQRTPCVNPGHTVRPAPPPRDRPHHVRRQADRSRQGTPSRRPSRSAPIHHHAVKVERQHTQTGRAPSVTGKHTSPLPPCPAPPARRQAAPCAPIGRQIAAGHTVPPSATPCAGSSPRREGRTSARRARPSEHRHATTTGAPTGRAMCADRPTDRGSARRHHHRHADTLDAPPPPQKPLYTVNLRKSFPRNHFVSHSAPPVFFCWVV